MKPFSTSGLPMMCIGKNLYLEVKDEKVDATVYCTFGFLPEKCRRKLANFRNTDDSDCGVKLLHVDYGLYQFVGMNDCGFSPNYLAKI